MEEYERKLSSNNPVLIAKVMSTLVEVISEKLKERSESKKKEIAELKYLKDKFINSDPNICIISGKALIYLIKCGILEISSMISEFVAMIPFAKNYRGIIMVLSDLLVLDLELKTASEEYVCPFNLVSPQQPLITILIQNPNVWLDILSYLRNIYETNNKLLITHLNELFTPLYKYIICDPFLKTPEYCRNRFLSFIINEHQHDLKLTLNIVVWLQIYSNTNQISTSNILMDIIKAPVVKNNGELQEFLVLCLFSLLHEMYLNKWDSTEVILTITEVIQDMNFPFINPAMVFVAKSIGIVPAMYLKDLLKLCLKMLNKGTINVVVKQCLKTNLLNWLLYPSILTNDCVDIMNELYNKLSNTDEEINKEEEDCFISNKYLQLFQNTNQQLHFIVEVCKLFDNKKLIYANILRILKYVENSSVLFLKHLYIFIAGIFLSDYDENITSKCLSLLIKYVSVNNEVASNVLTLVLYKLANTKDSKIHFELLKAIPKMGVVKENIQVILSTLHVLSTSSSKMKTFTMFLFYELWNCDTKYYPYLQKLLFEENPYDRANFIVTKAHILKELCKKKPELYGSELATHLSKILNTCKTDNGIASLLALEGLRYLCTGGVIDIITAWETLAPSFETEERENVIQSFCKLLSEVPELHTDVTTYDDLISDILNKLWDYTTNTNVDVANAAYEALSCFSHEQISRHFPEIYRDEETNKNASADAIVPASGEWWLSMLKNGNYAHFECITNFISNWVRKEIAEYGKGVYFMSENKAEPRDYHYLQIYSIVKALLKHVKLKHNTNSEIEVACLNILSQEYSKSLPPCDWSFLHELVHVPQYRKYCILIASHQVNLSGTARRFMENFVIAITEKPNVEDILIIMSVLKFLCNSIQPMILRPFVQVAFKFALDKIDEENDTLLYDDIINYLILIFNDKDIHEANKSVLGKLMVETIQDMPLSSDNFRKLLECVILLPYKYIKESISPKSWPEIKQYNFRRAVVIRCAIATSCEDTPMVWFNEIIEVSGDLKGDQLFVLQHVSKALDKCKNHTSIPNWILELLGQTQVFLIDSNHFTNQVAFMCDVLMISILTTSSHGVFLNSERDINLPRTMFLFPQAMAVQLKNDKWNDNVPQVLEWLHYMVNFEGIPQSYKTCFCQTLIALRHEPMFKESLKWLKYIGCKLQFEI